MSTYSEQLKDPRWQRKRLEIMDRDGWACRRCNSTTKTLNVHHIEYFGRLEPWNYPDHMLITLCEDDHEIEECFKYIANAKLIETIRGMGAMNHDIERIIFMIRELGGGLIGLALLQHALDKAAKEAKK